MKRALGSLVLAAVCIATAVWWWQSPDSGSTTGLADRNAAQAGRSPQDFRLAGRPERTPPTAMTLQAAYHFELAAPAPLGPMDVAVRGVLELAHPVQLDGATWVPVRLTAATVQVSESVRKVLDLSADGSGLEHPWLLKREPDGRVSEVRFNPATPVAGQSVLAALAFSTQLVRPVQADATAWQAEEVDANGAFQASYVRSADGSVTKRWSSGPARPGQRTETTAHYTSDIDGLQHVAVDEVGKATTGQLAASSFVPMRLTIDLVRTGKSDGRWAAGLATGHLRAYTAATAKVNWRREAEVTRAYDDVLADVEGRAGATDAGGRVNLRNELTRAIAASPEAVSRTDALLRARTLEESAETLVVAALVGARTPEAQTAVGGLVKDPAVPEPLRLRMLQSASLMSSPTPAFVATFASLATLAADPAYRGAVATTLGQSIAFLEEQHPVEAAQQIAAFIDQATLVLAPQADDHGQPQPAALRIAWLAGLGNTGHAEALPLILASLKDDNELVRGGAVLALRRQSASACIDALLDLMAHDGSVHVRENVLDVAMVMGPAVTEPMVRKALYFDDSAFVRSAAAYVVSTWSTDSPGMRAVLVDALKHEKSPEVAERLQNFIQQGRVAGNPGLTNTKMGAHP
ncbi:MAG: HEAT repeat domain-containing protein [Myxococcota bacterium]